MKTNISLLKWEEFPFFNLKIWSYITLEGFNVQQNRKNIQNVMTFYLFAVKIKSLLIDKCMAVKFTSLLRVNMKKTRT